MEFEKEVYAMKFKVTRTNTTDEKPCDGAIKEIYSLIDKRHCMIPEDIHNSSKYKRFYLKWHELGTNHRITDDGIERELQREGWFITLDSLEELIKFKNSVGKPCIVSTSGNINTIEIYDGYRE